MWRERDGFGWLGTLKLACDFAFACAVGSAAGAVVAICYVEIWCK